MSITFKRKRMVTKVVEEEVEEDVQVCVGVHGEGCLPATPDDLRRACEAVGMALVDEGHPRMRGRTIDVMFDECEDLEALEQNVTAFRGKSCKGRSLGAYMAKLISAADKAERERDTALARAEKAEKAHNLVLSSYGSARETVDDLRTKLAAAEAEIEAVWKTVGGYTGTQRPPLEPTVASYVGRLAALTAPVEGEPKAEDLRKGVDADGLRIGVNAALLDVWRAGFAAGAGYAAATARRDGVSSVGECTRCGGEAGEAHVCGAVHYRHTRDLPRATDAELVEAYAAKERVDDLAHGLRAVYDLGRREQCLVTRAVEAGRQVVFWKRDDGNWRVGVDDKGQTSAPDDVPAALSAMLGEVGR